ncbi:MAG: cadherin repeat domain-containing protein [Lachnospiraceae bacterium]|nr:cadherin repeat domain-containing protein [Lachnospiraceae bacterium]
MKKELTEKLMEKWFMITAAAMVFFFINTAAVISAYAGDTGFRVLDMMGREVLSNEDQEYLATSDVVFEFVNLNEPADEDDRGRDWLFCEKDTVDGRDIYTPVKDNRYSPDITGDTEISFVWIDRISGETKEEKSLPRSFRIKYINPDGLSCVSEFSHEGASSGYRLNGSKPALSIDPPEAEYTFLSVLKNDEEEVYELTGGHNVFTFEEGEYELKLWSEDGWGVRRYHDLECESFQYDASSPAMGGIRLRPSDRNAYTKYGKVYTSKSLLIIPEASDSLSGIDHYVFHTFNNTDKSEYEAYGDELQLDPGFTGIISVYAVDRAGNTSEQKVSPEIIIDNTDPVLNTKEIEAMKGKKDGIKILLTAEDNMSGLKELTLFLNGEELCENSLSGEKSAGLEKNLETGDLKEGRNNLKLRILDMTGNESVYDFSIEKEDERGKDEEGDEPVQEESGDEAPEMYLKGFKNFQKTEKDVRIEAGLSNNFPDEGHIYIERHGLDGELLESYEAEPGLISVSDEGNYAVHYEIENGGSVYERSGYFTIDRSSPMIRSLKEIDRKSFNSFSLSDDPLGSVEDLTYVNAHMTLSGREYDGRKISEPGKYILKITATDELGHRAEESAEFLIVKNDESKTLSGNTLSANSPAECTASSNALSLNAVSANSHNNKTITQEKENWVNQGKKNLARPGSGAREKTIYKTEMTVIPIIIMCSLLLCLAGMVILVVYPAMERNR